MNETMKGNLQLGLLVVIAATVIYGTFIKEDLPARSGRVAQQAAPAPQGQPNLNAVNNPNNFQQPSQPIQQAPPKPTNPPTTVQFAEMNHSFGTIDQDTENEKVFTFTNTGSKPLIIENAVGSCGCTVPEYPKEPIAPGSTGEIRVVYKPGKQQGKQQ